MGLRTDSPFSRTQIQWISLTHDLVVPQDLPHSLSPHIWDQITPKLPACLVHMSNGHLSIVCCMEL